MGPSSCVVVCYFACVVMDSASRPQFSGFKRAKFLEPPQDSLTALKAPLAIETRSPYVHKPGLSPSGFVFRISWCAATQGARILASLRLPIPGIRLARQQRKER